MSRPVKRSFTIRGHRTSVSLEAEFWDALREVAAAEGVTPSGLIATVDAARAPGSGLSGAVRCHVLRHFRERARDRENAGSRTDRSAQ
jgi:predicted DNA-binding ribbon-helix-helix protein